MPVLTALLDQNKDAEDPFIPWQIWWALEDKAFSGKDQILSYFAKPGIWNSKLASTEALHLIRRYSAEGSREGYNAADALLDASPPADLKMVLEALNRGLSERAGLAKPPDNGLFVEEGRRDLPATGSR